MTHINKLRFRILSPEERGNLSVKEITNSEVYDADGYPVEGGVMDAHLGVIDPGMVCRTCGGEMKECNGHFGHIDLSKPVVHVLYVKQIREMLRATCNNCHAFIEESIEKKKRSGFTCQECDEEQTKVKLDKPYFFYEGDRMIRPEEVRERLQNIPDDALESFDFEGGRPEWLVMDRVLVPPVTVRPSITLESGERSEDDLTHKLVDIIRINHRLQNNIEIDAPEFIIEDLWELLQYHVSTLFNNELTGVPPARHRSGRPIKSIIERLKGKEGRFRKNLIGKRANFSARTVISPDPNIDIDEVGIPEEIAAELTIPVTVTEHNLSEAKEWIRRGEDTWPGANYVKRPDGVRKRVTEENKTELLSELQEGYVIERHLMDGDIVLFNRQPSLHRMSMMAHRARIMPYRTFRLNLCACAPYNADFDGDEMNLHIPQNEEAKAEARELMKVENHIKSPKFGGPLVGMIQDSISGLYLLTQEDTRLTREAAYDLLCAAGRYDADLPEKEEVTGKDVFNTLLPDDLNVSTDHFVIENGELVEGQIDERAVGDYGGEVINRILMDIGREEAVDFLNDASRLGITYLTRRGFSISVSDISISDAAQQDIDERIQEGIDEADDILERHEAGDLERIPGKTEQETLEIKLLNALRDISNDAEPIVTDDLGDTSARVMAESGARGSMTNIAVMAGLLGQETIRGKRIARGYKKRSLPHFRKGDRSPKARGFVRSSINAGMDPVEMFYEIMSGREGLMDQSLRTRTSGYMYRRVLNAMQDLRVAEDRSVRAADGTVVQFLAGEDGIDPQKSDRGELVREVEEHG